MTNREMMKRKVNILALLMLMVAVVTSLWEAVGSNLYS